MSHRQHGKKTWACAGLAAASASTMLFDPTLASLATFTAAGTGAAIGATYHCGRKVVGVFFNSEKKDADASDDKFDPVELEAIIRKLSSSFTGIAVSSTLAIVLPHLLVGTALTAVEFTAGLRKLRKMAKSQGTSVRDLLHCISKLDLAMQIMAGLVLKTAFSMLFLGPDFHAWAQVIEVDLQSGASGGKGMATWLQGVDAQHQILISHGILHESTAIADGPGNAMTEILTGSTTTPVWHGGADGTAIVAIGTTNATTDFVLGKLVEEPAHEAANVTFRAGRRFLGHNKTERRSLLPNLCERDISHSRVVKFEKIRHL